MRTCQKVFVVLFCVIMLFGLLPTGALAKSNDERNSGFSISDVTVEGKTATVAINNQEACKLVAALYDPDTDQMLASGITDVAANAGSAQVEFNIAAMPPYYVVRAFALDSGLGALCDKFESRLHTKTFENFQQVTVSVCAWSDNNAIGLPAAAVTADDGFCDKEGDGQWNDHATQTDESGNAVFLFAPGNHTIAVSASGYYAKTVDFSVDETTKTLEVALFPKDGSAPGQPGDGSSDGTGSDDGWLDRNHIQFGSYPQTDVTESMGAVLDSKASGWKSYRYFSGSGSTTDGKMTAGDYMLYCDVTYESNKYRGVTFGTYRPICTGYQTTASANEKTFQDDNGYVCGKVYWFLYEPLQWRVVNSQIGLALCESIVDSQPYSNFLLRSNGENYNDAGALATDWDTSSLKAWLNADFTAAAFTAEQQNAMLSLDGSAAGEKVFVLTEPESTNPVYFSRSALRQAKGSDYAKCQGLQVDPTGYSDWRTRSPGVNSYYTTSAFFDGTVGELCSVCLSCVGIRPAIKLELSSLSTQSALGTQSICTEQAMIGTGVFDYSCSDCDAGSQYILLNVTGYGDSFTLTADKLEYIDQLTADPSGKVAGRFTPRKNVAGSTTLLIGPFGGKVSARVLTTAEETTGTPDPVIPSFNIKNYKKSLTVAYQSKLVFHTDIEAPEGYRIVWSTGDIGPTCVIDRAVEGEYRIKADLVRIDDNTVYKTTQEETVTVRTSIFARIIAFFRGLLHLLPVYEDNVKQKRFSGLW